ncbi:MAG: hypothetical protein ACYCPX_12680 [Acidiferrobacteraceae bacterium]
MPLHGDSTARAAGAFDNVRYRTSITVPAGRSAILTRRRFRRDPLDGTEPIAVEHGVADDEQAPARDFLQKVS